MSAREYKCRYCNLSCSDKEVLYTHIRSNKECTEKHYGQKEKKDTKLTEKSLDENTITFGKYKDLTLSQMLRDRKYCQWLLQQDWFAQSYEYLYNRVRDSNPRQYFVLKPPYKIGELTSVQDFLDNYEYFHLCPPKELTIELTENEKTCYRFYLDTIQSLAEKIGENVNPFDIKAPSSWLKRFETKSGLSRDIFKEFLSAYGLPNIPYIVEDIKKMGGIEYKGAKSFLIAKDKSLQQEQYWEKILKTRYGEDIGTQYKFRNCIFDFIHIKTNTLYECKLGLKDFNEDQHSKYLVTLGNFSLVYLIDRDCIVDLCGKILYTTDVDKYSEYLLSAPEQNKLVHLMKSFTIQKLSRIEDYF